MHTTLSDQKYSNVVVLCITEFVHSQPVYPCKLFFLCATSFFTKLSCVLCTIWLVWLKNTIHSTTVYFCVEAIFRYSWSGPPSDTQQKTISEKNVRATTNPRLCTKISWQGESKSAVSIFPSSWHSCPTPSTMAEWGGSHLWGLRTQGMPPARGFDKRGRVRGGRRSPAVGSKRAVG